MQVRRTFDAVRRVPAVRDAVRRWRNEGHTVAFVPTMGHLHAGHLSLVEHARKQADRRTGSE